MRGSRKRKPIIAQTRIPGEVTQSRESVERHWYKLTERDDALSRRVTAQDARNERYHRWLVFKQAFSPELVRIFRRSVDIEGPILDPFSGTGTTVVECARQNIPAIGIEPIAATAFAAASKFHRDLPDLPDLPNTSDWPDIADRLTHPLHRTALIAAQSDRLTATGTINANAPDICTVFKQKFETIRDDLADPLKRENLIICADSRDLAFIDDNTIGGILTSPPYLSRHDYTKLTAAFQKVYHHWYPQAPAMQLPAHPKATTRTKHICNHPAVIESADTLKMINQSRLARVVRNYFDGMEQAVTHWHRVLMSGASAWCVIGGARFKDVYIPADTIFADVAKRIGFHIDEIRVARRLIDAGRKFGTLNNVAPRESIVMMHKK